MRILTFLTVLCVSLGAMIWSAAPPYHPAGISLSRLTQPARDSLGVMAGWFRPGRVEGHPDWQSAAQTVPGGSVTRGKARVVHNGCGACHAIPGIPGARGTVGPPLRNIADRAYLAGVLPNTPGGMIRWLMNPPAHNPATAMPDLGLDETAARDIAAFLMTLRGRG